jgi:hypothetical protein
MTPAKRFWQDPAGSASIEFVFVFPVIMMLFLASIEAGVFTLRHVMLERNVDIVVRDIRLGRMDGATHEELKEEICELGTLIGSNEDCVESMQIWLQPINTANFDMAIPPNYCVDKSLDPIVTVEPTPDEFAFGSDNDIVLMRVCLSGEPWFPTSVVGANMTRGEDDGNYALVTTSVFVNEPG